MLVQRANKKVRWVVYTSNKRWHHHVTHAWLVRCVIKQFDNLPRRILGKVLTDGTTGGILSSGDPLLLGLRSVSDSDLPESSNALSDWTPAPHGLCVTTACKWQQLNHVKSGSKHEIYITTHQISIHSTGTHNYSSPWLLQVTTADAHSYMFWYLTPP